jgi:uncharacterized protein (TIGR02118 family)
LVNALILFGVPTESEAFDEYFTNHHMQLLRAVPNVEKIILNQIAGAAHGESPYYLVVELQFNSEEAMQEGLNSEAGQAMANDLSQFASGGVSVLFAQVAVESLRACETKS